MDVLYYSNYCKHCQKLLQFLVKNNLASKLNCICIDKRYKDPKTQQMYIVLENGQQLALPPNVHSVPSLLLVKQKFSVLTGEPIYEYFNSFVQVQNNSATQNNGEPMGYAINGGLGGNVGGGLMENTFMSATHSDFHIAAPPETYTSNKIKGDSSLLDNIKQMRDQDLKMLMPPPMDIGHSPGNMATIPRLHI